MLVVCSIYALRSLKRPCAMTPVANTKFSTEFVCPRWLVSMLKLHIALKHGRLSDGALNHTHDHHQNDAISHGDVVDL